MIKRFKVVLLALIAFTMVTNIAPIYGDTDVEPPLTYEGVDKTYLFFKDGKATENLTFDLKQGSEIIGEGGTIDLTKPIRLDFDMMIPVLGDFIVAGIPEENVNEAQYIKKGDFINIPISKDFKLKSDEKFDLTVLFKNEDGSTTKVKVGTVNVVNSKDENGIEFINANIVFDGNDDVFNGKKYHGVVGEFYIDLLYNGKGDFDDNGNKYVGIMDKEFILNKPADEKKYGITKEASEVNKDGEITWTVTLTGELKSILGDSKLDLNGVLFSDDLTNAGSYVEDSFKITSGDKTVSETPYYLSINDKTQLNYTFKEGSISPQTITYKTKLSDKELFGNEQIIKKNTASIFDENDEFLGKDDASSTYTPSWIEKTGKSDYQSGNYDPTNQTITWKITINKNEKALKNVKITDVLKDGLTFKSATLLNKDGSPRKEFTTEPPNGIYDLEDIDTEVTLVIVTNVPVPKDGYIFEEGLKFSNDASVSWDGQDGGYDSGFEVGIGFNTISKEGVADSKNQKITWTVEVDTRGQEQFPKNLTVYDLIIHGAEKPNMVKPDGISEAMFENLLTTPSLNQRYIEGTFASDDNLHLEVIKVYSDADSKNHVADLLIVSGEGTKKDKFTFNFDTYIVNPDITLGNKTSTLSNKAFLYSGETSLGDATADKEYKNKLISKKVIDRKSHNLIPKTEAANDVNNANGYNYIDHSVVYRLDVNIDGINISDIENANGESMGKVTVVDTLPLGWDFIDIISGEKYLIYEYKDGKAVGDPLTLDNITDGPTRSFEDEAATFTFTFENLDKAYVILVKARPSQELIKKYFSNNTSTPVVNNMNLSTDKWKPGVGDSEEVIIKSEVLDKKALRNEDGTATWTITYNPYNNVGAFEKTMRLVDTLPLGLELQRNAEGVIRKESITLSEYKVLANGQLEHVQDIDDFELSVDAYNPVTRELTFEIPDSKKAYKFTYLTNIVGDPSNTPITNKVKLEGEEESDVQAKDEFTITDEDSAASMKRMGSFQVNKIDSQNNPLVGVGFTLFAEDGVTVHRKAKTNDQGNLNIRGLVAGTYILKETDPLTGYVSDNLTYIVEVIIENNTVLTKVNGEVLNDGLTIVNHKEGTQGSLELSKKIAGNAASEKVDFVFTVEFINLPKDAKFKYLHSGDGLVHELVNGGTVSLKAKETVTIVGIPKDTEYLITEEVHEGYNPVKPKSGTIEADEVVKVEFVNYKDNTVTLTKQSKFEEVIDHDSIRFSLYKLVNGDYEPVPNAQDIALKNGKIVWKGLDIGKYKFKEVKTSSDYILNQEDLYFEITEDQNEKDVAEDKDLVFINYQGKAKLVKLGDNGEEDFLENVLFELYKDGVIGDDRNVITEGTLVRDDLVTNANGEILVDRLAPGKYYFKEVSNPNGHVVDDRVISFVIESEYKGELEVKVSTATNSKASAQMKKTDEKSVGISGAEFELKLAGSTKPYATVVADEKGIVNFEGLIVGSYEIRETKAAAGFIRNTDVITFEVESNTDKDLVIIELPDFVNYKGSASITKTGKDKNPLQGAEFSLYKYLGEEHTDETVVLFENLKTNEEGHILVTELEPGDYYFMETKAAPGYIRSTEKFKFTIASEALDIPAVVNVDVVNYKGSASLIKTDESGNALQGSIFQLSLITGEESKVVQTITSDENGLVKFENLVVGHYIVTEKDATKGYIRNEEVYQFEIEESSSNGKIHVDLDNFINYKGSVELIKLDEDDKVLEGVVFEFYLDGSDEKVQYTTDKDGKILVTDLAPGTYYFKEVSTPHGHIINTTPIEVVIAESHSGKLELIQTSAANAYAKAEFKKVDEDNNALSGAVFELYLNKAIYGRITSDENGLVSFDGLVAGNYVIREVKAAPGFLLNEEIIEFTVEESSDKVKDVYTFEDYVNYQGSVTLVKLGNDTNPLQNVVFELYKEALDEESSYQLIPGDFKTDKDGILTIEKLAPGNYYFLETETVDGHILYTGKIPFVIEDSSLAKPAQAFITLTNQKGSVEFNKVDVDGNPLKGAEFELYLGKAIYEKAVSDENGLVVFKDLIPGKYLVKESIAADGYVLNTKEFEFEINETTDQEKVHLVLDEYVNYKGDVLLNKVDESNKVLEGVVFDLYNEADELVFEGLETDENGQLRVEDLAVGVYYFKEISSVDGNLVNTEKHYFTITDVALDKPEDVILTVSNAKGLVEFTKVDEEGNPLEGAKFELYIEVEDELKLVATVESDKDGYVFVDGLVAGNYVFKEVETVDGYVLNTREVEFTIVAEAEVEKVVVTLDDYVNYQGGVVVNKVNVDGELLKGAKFELLDSDYEVIYDFTIIDGTIELDKLAPGVYYLREVSAPKDYLLSEELYEFTIEGESLDKPEFEEINFVNFEPEEDVLGEDNIPTGVSNNIGYLFLLFALSAMIILINSKTFVRKVRSKK